MRTAHGTALEVTAHGSSDIADVEVTLTPQSGGAATVISGSSFTLVQGQPDNGVWETTGSLGLARTGYSYTADVVDASGAKSPSVAAPGWLSYQLQPSYHDLAISPDNLDVAHTSVTASGKVTTYDPASGDTATPYSGQGLDLRLNGGLYSADTSPSAVDGSFSVTVNVDVTQPSVSMWLQAMSVSDNTELLRKTIDVYASAPTRITLDRTSAVVVAGRPMTVSGKMEYQDVHGVWQPLGNSSLELWVGSSDYGWTGTDATGRFAFVLNAPATVTTLMVRTPGLALIKPSSATFNITSVTQQVSLTLYGASIDQFSDLTFFENVASTNHKIPNGRVYVLESPDGRTNWRNLGYILVSRDTYGQQISAWVDNPHGYWMLYSPAAPGYAAATSNVVHTFAYKTLITGGKPRSTTVYRYSSLSFSGGLYFQGFGPWAPIKHTRVYLFFRPYGSKNWSEVSSAVTDQYGHYRLSGRATRGGTWEVAWFTPNQWYVDAFGPGTYVSVR